MKTVHVAVIGVGFIGPAHIETLRRVPGVSVQAIVSTNMRRAKALAGQFGVPRTYRKWEAVMSDSDIDVVHNCTPNNLHYQINKAAILAGKHILSEKPLTTTSRESAELLALVRRKGVVHGVNYNYRFYPLIQHARRLVHRGDLGEVRLVHGHYLQDWLIRESDYNWRVEAKRGGTSRAFADIGTHWCDLVQFITGREIISVCADLVIIHKTRKKPPAIQATFKGKERVLSRRTASVAVSTEDAGIVMFELDNGARGVVAVSQVSAGRKNREWFEIDGSERALAWDQEEPNILWIGHRDRPNECLMKDPSLMDRRTRAFAHFPGGHPEGYPDGLKNLFIRFYDFIQRRKDPRKDSPDFPTFFDGHRENRIVEAVLESQRRRRWTRAT